MCGCSKMGAARITATLQAPIALNPDLIGAGRQVYSSTRGATGV